MIGLVFAGISILNAIVAAGIAYWVGRRAAESVFQDLEHVIDAERLKTSGLRDQAHDYFERAETARARSRSAQQRAEKATETQGDAQPAMTQEQYRYHIETGGPRLFEVESGFGWPTSEQ